MDYKPNSIVNVDHVFYKIIDITDTYFIKDYSIGKVYQYIKI